MSFQPARDARRPGSRAHGLGDDGAAGSARGVRAGRDPPSPAGTARPARPSTVGATSRLRPAPRRRRRRDAPRGPHDQRHAQRSARSSPKWSNQMPCSPSDSPWSAVTTHDRPLPAMPEPRRAPRAAGRARGRRTTPRPRTGPSANARVAHALQPRRRDRCGSRSRRRTRVATRADCAVRLARRAATSSAARRQADELADRRCTRRARASRFSARTGGAGARGAGACRRRRARDQLSVTSPRPVCSGSRGSPR